MRGDEISLLRQFLQEDSEYPDWLWTLEVKRPLPPLEEQDPNTKEYWLQVVAKNIDLAIYYKV